MQSRITQLLSRYVAAILAAVAGYSASGDTSQVEPTTQAVVSGLLAIGLFVADQFLHSKLFKEKA